MAPICTNTSHQVTQSAFSSHALCDAEGRQRQATTAITVPSSARATPITSSAAPPHVLLVSSEKWSASRVIHISKNNAESSRDKTSARRVTFFTERRILSATKDQTPTWATDGSEASRHAQTAPGSFITTQYGVTIQILQ
ncbi:hypothetical protein E2C01_013049 [Portunus trituberculatus]|uniref:Uncharacterized protein n=1 Tax=Portunus trituberculatus TaxID=210409 RepID=A0A5B7DG24_PORTR|nr:hypothetical protein [Portunus trituberculatus]